MKESYTPLLDGRGRVIGSRLVVERPPNAPAPAEPATTPYMTHFGFLARLSPQERTAIRRATANDPILDDAMFLFNSAEHIDVTLAETQQLVGYLALQGHIKPERVPELLAPIPLDSPHAKV